ncbi:MAG: fibrobacter succinogenes major paralogous domain-containing protein [Fibromonadales bacterium]|nr:fibrobacter succinogenes major paralogous domain-containing protein [Fibromonadales bacterium]
MVLICIFFILLLLGCSEYDFSGDFCGSLKYNTLTHFCADEVLEAYGASSGVSSSSVSLSSSSKTYRTVVIGEQTWMAENLNYNVSGSKCYNNSESNCDIYGRLYDWATAMALPASCNSSTCSSQVQSKHQGICPSGWHIPSRDEWDKLFDYVGGSSVVGKHLKSKTGWSNCGPSGSGSSYSCEDTYGFSALPGGNGYSGGSFDDVGSYGDWWSASEDDASDAYYWGMYYNIENAYWDNDDKTYLFAVRCLEDSAVLSSSSLESSSSSFAPSSSSVVPSSSSVALSSSSSSISYGTLSYQGQNYKTVVIGIQTWMAENLNYNVSGSKCYGNSDSNCDTYGRLYNWATAMALPESCNSSTCSDQIQSPYRGVCPEGWHIPSDADWDALMTTVGGSSMAGTKLKATSGWYSGGNGTDDYGFLALPGGYGFSDGSFGDVGNVGNWWSASEYSSNIAYRRYMGYNGEDAYWYSNGKTYLFAVRCLED